MFRMRLIASPLPLLLAFWRDPDAECPARGRLLG